MNSINNNKEKKRSRLELLEIPKGKSFSTINTFVEKLIAKKTYQNLNKSPFN